MGTVKSVVLFVALFLLAASGPSFAMSLERTSDAELDGIHARGLDFLFDANTFLAGTGGSQGGSVASNLNPINVNFSGTNNLTLKNSIWLSGNAQQSGLGIVNAVNSTVNMPINITVLINSQVNGGLRLSNLIGGTTR